MKKAIVSPEYQYTTRMYEEADLCLWFPWLSTSSCLQPRIKPAACELRAEGHTRRNLPQADSKRTKAIHNDWFSVSNLLEQLQSPSLTWKTVLLRLCSLW